MYNSNAQRRKETIGQKNIFEEKQIQNVMKTNSKFQKKMTTLPKQEI